MDIKSTKELRDKQKPDDLVTVYGLQITRAQEEQLLMLGKSTLHTIKRAIKDYLSYHKVTYRSRFADYYKEMDKKKELIEFKEEAND
jgi:hypothetical protein